MNMEKWQAAKDWCDQRIGCPYIMGATGKVCTPSYRQARMAQYPGYAEKMKKNCPRLMGKADTCAACKWADPNTGKGKLAYDCAQLSRWCMDFVGISLVSGATSQWNETAWAERGEIATMPRDKVCLVFRRDDGKMAHVGVYQGDGYVIHAKGHDWGVVKERLDDIDKPMTHWGIPMGLYDGQYERPTLRRGDNNEYVRVMQQYLVNNGYSLKPTKTAANGCDGIFGADTEATLIAFQAEHGLPTDGVCDAATWAALECPEAEPEVPSVDDDDIIELIEKIKDMAKETERLAQMLLDKISEANV